MKHLTLVWIVTFFSAEAHCQQIVNEYKNYNIKNSSCDVFDAINAELRKPPYAGDLQNLKPTMSFQTQKDVEEYFGDFNATLEKTKRQYESQEFLWKTGKEIGKYGLSVLGNYAQALPTKHLTNFLTPAIQQGYELYVDNEINKGIDEHKEDIDKLVRDRINLLYSNGFDVTKTTDEESFKAMFSLAHADIPALSRDQYGAFNKELTKFAYDYIAKNRAELKLLDLKASQQYELVKNEVESKIAGLQNQITNDVNGKLKDLGNSIVVLAENQESIFKTLGNIQKRVVANEKRILQLEKEMLLVKDDIEQLKSKQAEHSTLIAQNSFQIDILSGYTFQNLNTDQKLNALQKGHFDNVFKGAEKQKLISELEELKTKETIISVSQTVQNYANASFGVLEASGVLKGKEARVVGKFVHGLSIATGLAKVFAGDFTGFSSIISGLGGLFSKPKPSPEIQMMQQMCEIMNQRFDNIEKHLDRIETKIDSLSSLVFNMYKNMVFSFQYINSQMERLNWKMDNMNVKATAILYKDYQACKTLRDSWDKRKVKFESYSDFKTYYNANCQKCLEGLNDFTIGKNLSYFYMFSNERLKSEKFVEIEVNHIYRPTCDLFMSFYSESIERALYALMFPVIATNDANKPLYIISEIKDVKALNADDVIENYYSYEMISEFSDLFLRFSSYFETAGRNSDFEPATLSEYLSDNSVNGVSQDLLEARLIKLLNLSQFSIAQQSLLSGNLMLDPIYSTLFGYSTNQNEFDLTIKVLNNNKLLASNFATYMINKSLCFNDTLQLQRLFQNGALDSKCIDTLNALVRYNDIKFISDATEKRIYLTFNKKGQTVKIQCPNFTILATNRMVISDAIFSLLESRQSINSKLINLTFTKNLDDTKLLPVKFKYNYVPSSK